MSAYLRRVRAKVGNEFLLMPSVTAVVFDAKRRVLMVRPSRREVWVAPGGAVDPDEAAAGRARTGSVGGDRVAGRAEASCSASSAGPNTECGTPTATKWAT